MTDASVATVGLPPGEKARYRVSRVSPVCAAMRASFVNTSAASKQGNRVKERNQSRRRQKRAHAKR